MENYYTFIAYKANSDDYCRGCHVCSYNSDFNISNHLNQSELISQFADFLHRNMRLDTGESGYEFIIMKDGITLYNTIESTDGFYWDARERFYKTGEKLDIEHFDNKEIKEMDDMKEIIDKAKLKSQLLYDEGENRKKLELEESKKKEQKSDLEKRKKQFEKLKKEFEGSDNAKI